MTLCGGWTGQPPSAPSPGISHVWCVGKLPRVSGKELLRFLQGQGFEMRRIRGSHHMVVRGKQRSTIPVHGNRPLRIGTFHGILRDIELSAKDFEKLWRSPRR